VTGTILNSSSSPAISTSTYGRYYSITNSAFATITLPSSSAGDIGSFWVFRNNTAAYLSITVTYAGTGGGGTGLVTIPPANALTIVFTTSTSGLGAYTFF
jgi:hypothetical protein